MKYFLKHSRYYYRVTIFFVEQLNNFTTNDRDHSYKRISQVDVKEVSSTKMRFAISSDVVLDADSFLIVYETAAQNLHSNIQKNKLQK